MSKNYQRTSSGWSEERRAKHSAAIRRWAPWTQSTGPRTLAGKAISRCNALTHGATSRPAKDFMRKFYLYRDFLRLCWKMRAGLAEKARNEKNELLNRRKRPRKSVQKSAHPHPNSPHILSIKFGYGPENLHLQPKRQKMPIFPLHSVGVSG